MSTVDLEIQPGHNSLYKVSAACNSPFIQLQISGLCSVHQKSMASQ